MKTKTTWTPKNPSWNPSAPSTRPRHGDAAICNRLGELACEDIEQFLLGLDVDLRRQGRRYVGPCPVHGGDKAAALHLYPEGIEVSGNWVCLTRGCQKHFVRSLIGFVRGVLSARMGWKGPGDQTASQRDAVDETCRILGISLKDVEVDVASHERKRFVADMEALARRRPKAYEPFLTPSAYRRQVEIPSRYWKGRGFSEGVLREFEVGDVVDERSPSFGNAVYPVYDPDGSILVGLVARDPHAATKDLRWNVIGNWSDKQHLLGYARAKPHVKATGTVVIVEGAADLFKLWEANLRNAVCCFGNFVHPMQEVLLQELAARDVVVIPDNDPGGDALVDDVVRKMGTFSNVRRLRPTREGGDVGDMTVAEVVEHLKPHIATRKP